MRLWSIVEQLAHQIGVWQIEPQTLRKTDRLVVRQYSTGHFSNTHQFQQSRGDDCGFDPGNVTPRRTPSTRTVRTAMSRPNRQIGRGAFSCTSTRTGVEILGRAQPCVLTPLARALLNHKPCAFEADARDTQDFVREILVGAVVRLRRTCP